jgi:Lon protease-like protein
MVETCLRGDGCFGVVLIERGHEVGGGDQRFAVGTVARIVDAARTPDGRFLLACVGTDRLRVRRWLPAEPYPRAEVELVREAPALGAPAHEHRDQVERLLVRVLAMRAELGEPAPPVDAAQLDDDPVRASFEGAAMAPVGPLDAQALLEVDDADERLQRLVGLLTDAVELLELRLSGG